MTNFEASYLLLYPPSSTELFAKPIVDSIELMAVSGDGFVTMADGTLRWGRFGAAGVLVCCAAEADGSPWYFLARRSEWCHQGGTWAIPGGALNQGESPVDGALREFTEEIGLFLGQGSARVVSVHEDDHGGWSYWTVVVEVEEWFAAPVPTSWETAETSWVTGERLAELELHDAFKATLVRLGFLEP
jgi:8-oxo-dGTP diphosphatase